MKIIAFNESPRKYDDYSKYVILASINPAEKAQRRDEIFPEYCQKAFDMGVRFTQQSNS